MLALGITNLNINILTKPQLLINMTHILYPHTSKLLQRIKFILSSDLHESIYYIPLEYLSLWDQIHILSKLPLLITISQTNLSEA